MAIDSTSPCHRCTKHSIAATERFEPSGRAGSKNPVPATAVVLYPDDYPMPGTWGGNGVANPVYNMIPQVIGIVFPQGTRTVPYAHFLELFAAI
jgi:hypothetical protein